MAKLASATGAMRTRSSSHHKTIRAQDVDALVRGCAVLGAGGGGDAFMFRIMAELALAETGPVPLKSLDELPEDGIVLPLAMVGAPMVFAEKILSGLEGILLRDEIEDALDRKVVAVMAPEIGGGNGVLPLAWAAHLGLPYVDADGMGRAFPTIPMTTMHLAGLPVSPGVIVDARNNVLRFETCDNFWAERLIRGATTSMGAMTSSVLYPMSVRDARRSTVLGSVSKALRVGSLLSVGADGVSRAVAELRATVLTVGKVVDIERRIEYGWVRGSLTVEGSGEYKGRLLHIEIQNENLVALEEGKVRASVPDLITVLETDSGVVISTERLRYGQRVTVIGFASDPVWRTPAGLQLGGPRAMGYDFDFVPIEEINA
ncbi:MAG: DUF917 domain-containing protein [Candidatus Dormibacteraceae bacterium]